MKSDFLSKIFSLIFISMIIFHVDFVLAEKPEPKDLNNDELCKIATFPSGSTKNWKVGNYKKYVVEAKDRGLKCDVKSLIAGEIIDITVSKVKLMLAHFELYNEIYNDEINENFYKSIKLLMDRKGFNYEDPRSKEAFTFVFETYLDFFDESQRKKFECDSIKNRLLPVNNFKESIYLCDLSTTLADINALQEEQLCDLATHAFLSKRRWNVGSKSIYANEAKRRGYSCKVNSVEEIELSTAQIQTRLHHFGYDPGVIDGAWGKKTQKSFKIFLKDNVQEQLDPKSDQANTFLYDLYNQKFEQTLESSVPCDYITNEIAGKKTPCIVIGQFNETQEMYPKSGLWDKRWAYPMTRINNQKNLEVVIWAYDIPVKVGVKYNGPGRTRMINFSVDMNKIWLNIDKIHNVNNSRKMPFQVRRHELIDLDNDGLKEFFLLGSREDGRGQSRSDGSTMFDKNFIYNFEKDEITTFGVPTFSHDYGIYDFNSDGYKDILDLTLSSKGFYYCDGNSLKCNWQPTNKFVNGSSFLEYDSKSNLPILAAWCGGSVQDRWLCWFKASLKGNKINFSLIDKAQIEKKYDAKVKWESFFGSVAGKRYQGWKIDGISLKKQFKKGGMGYYLKLIDLDGDNDLDTIVYETNHICIKKDESRDYFKGSDCWENTEYIDIVFLQENGEFKKVDSHKYTQERGGTVKFDYVDLNSDKIKDIHVIGHHEGKCINDLSTSYINDGKGNLSYFKNKDNFMGSYGCELSSHFFDFENEPYRLFTFKPKIKNTMWEDPEVYLGLEYLGDVKETVKFMPNSNICSEAVSYKNCATTGCEAIWSNEDERKKYVTEAKSRNLLCEVKSD